MRRLSTKARHRRVISAVATVFVILLGFALFCLATVGVCFLATL